MQLATADQLTELRNIWLRYRAKISLPPSNWWQTATDDAVWQRVVSQVVVVGAADPANRLSEEKVHARIAWNELHVATDSDAREAIWSVLREIKARYAGKQSSNCGKTTALVRNLRSLGRHTGGPKGFIRKIASLQDSAEMIAYVTEHLSYVKNKGARDLLTTGFGLVRDRIALDIRVLGALRLIGLQVPEVAPTGAVAYASLETALLEQVCGPLGICGAELDQLLFLNYDDIKARHSKETCEKKLKRP